MNGLVLQIIHPCRDIIEQSILFDKLLIMKGKMKRRKEGKKTSEVAGKKERKEGIERKEER